MSEKNKSLNTVLSQCNDNMAFFKHHDVKVWSAVIFVQRGDSSVFDD